MQPLDDKYYERLNEIAYTIQESELLRHYWEDESEENYLLLRQAYEPAIAQLYHEVAEHAPLQLLELEKTLLNPVFEGLFLPRILGYSVLRGEINEQYRYVRPNDHFKEVLLAICNSVHFDHLKKRIGQSIQVGFALSSDIWITNLLDQIENRRVRYFLQQQKNERYRDLKEREALYHRYIKQFRNEFFYSVEFPQARGEMKANFSALRLFLIKRFEAGGDNDSLKAQALAFLANPDFQNSEEYLQMLALVGNFLELTEEERQQVAEHFAREQANFPEFELHYLGFLADLYQNHAALMAPEADLRMARIVDLSRPGRIADFYRVAQVVHGLGYVHPDAIEAVRDFYNSHEGLSVESKCLRLLMLRYFTRWLQGISEAEYGDFFEMSKIFQLYIRIFGNQEFNQALEKAAQEYLSRLLKVYTDRRGKDYQDIRKFAKNQMVEMGLLTEKEADTIFRVRRSRRKADSDKDEGV
ncbi:MAG: hypothetical protein RMJ33_06820 [Saprospiraceae bacterium]|nr:hypothetical protein [Saprospiraceae bacterium]MDW8229534.1 hypothetical protein [Saprospiraceae bacterium]